MIGTAGIGLSRFGARFFSASFTALLYKYEYSLLKKTAAQKKPKLLSLTQKSHFLAKRCEVKFT